MMSGNNNAEQEINLNIYCQSHSLLFQFVLSEFLISYKQVQRIDTIYQQMDSVLAQQKLQETLAFSLSKLLELLPFLTGSHMVVIHEQTFPWVNAKGSLNKLRHYCYLLSHRYSDESDILNINMCVSKTFHSALQVREIIFSLQRQYKDFHNTSNYHSLYQLLEHLISNFKRVSRLIVKALILFKEDENILFFLLRHKSDFDQVYHTDFVAKILKKMFPQGLQAAAEFITRKYTQRGFSNLLEPLLNQVTQLEKTESAT